METIPRRRRVPLVVQITAAVLAGAAAMYVIQNARVRPFSWPRLLVSPPKAARGAVAPRPDRRLPVAETPARAPAPGRALLVKRERGAPDVGILGAYNDETAHPLQQARQAGFAPMGDIRLRQGESDTAIGAFGDDFQQIGFGNLAYQRAFSAAPLTRPRGKRTPILFRRKPLPASAVPIASPLHPEDWQPPYWTPDRQRQVALAGLLAVLGVGYVLLSFGWIPFAKPRQPENR